MLTRFWKLAITILYILKGKVSAKSSTQKSLVIVKIDAIGDYILFRNFLDDIKQSERYKGYKITLVGNVLWRDLYSELDKVDRTIWINHSQYSSSWKTRREFIAEITDTRYDELVVFHVSRSFTTELLAFAISAKRKTGMNGDRSYLSSDFTDRFYNVLIDIPGEYTHEFSRNAFFASVLLGTTINRFIPSLTLNNTKSIIEPGMVVIAPGAGVTQRQLPVNKLTGIVKQMLDKGQKVCIIGSKGDQSLAAQIIFNTGSNENIFDYTGKTTLADLPHLIASSKMVICNDSSTYHFAVALRKMVVCFAGGGHFRRFVKYDDSPLIRLAYHQMDCFNCNWNCIYPEQAKTTYPCISLIEEPVVEKTIAEILNA